MNIGYYDSASQLDATERDKLAADIRRIRTLQEKLKNVPYDAFMAGDHFAIHNVLKYTPSSDLFSKESVLLLEHRIRAWEEKVTIP